MTARERFDLVVVGGGMAGMSAAAQAADAGARVLVCEIADHLGGTAVLSTGNVWTVPTADAFRQADPDGDIVLWQAVHDDLEDSLAWLAGLGVPVKDRHRSSSSSTYDPPPVGRNVDIETFVARARRMVEAADGWVLNGVTVERLHAGAGPGFAVDVLDAAHAERITIAAASVVLATGGFQNNAELRAEHLGASVGAQVRIRSNPHSEGAGLRLALAAGAQPTPRMDTFYGVLLPAVPGPLSEGDFRGLVLHSAVYGVVLAADGRRLTDESRGAVPLANRVAGVGRAVLVLGPETLEASETRLGIDLRTVLADAAARGARCVTDADRSEFAAMLTLWGYDGPQAERTLADFDRHLGVGTEPGPPRRRHRMPVGEEGLAAVEVQAAMTSTFGGIRTDSRGRALGVDGLPVAGLYVAGVDQGGYNVSGYAGGLSRALVFGRRAARHALAIASSQP